MEDRNLEKLMLTGVDVALNYLHNLGEVNTFFSLQNVMLQ